MSKTIHALAAASVLFAPLTARASTLTTIHAFIGSDGAQPMAGLTKVGTHLYGTTCAGGTNNQGTIYRIPPIPTFTIYNFGSPSTNGICPQGDLVKRNNHLFGTTSDGGLGYGTVFRILWYPPFTPQQLWSFNSSPDGALPQSSNLLYRAGAFYGTTEVGGAGFGTVFKLKNSPPGTWTETPASSFTSPTTETAGPQAGVIYYNGYFYGTATKGGANLHGNIFKTLAVPPYTTTDIYDFGAPGQGAEPRARLVLAGNMMYGTTATGNGNPQTWGTVFRFDPSSNSLNTLYTFQNVNDGYRPLGDIVFDAINPNILYGTTAYGGNNMSGTVYAVDVIAMTKTIQYDINGASDGSTPFSGLMYDVLTNAYYGTTAYAGTGGSGTVFKFVP